MLKSPIYKFPSNNTWVDWIEYKERLIGIAPVIKQNRKFVDFILDLFLVAYQGSLKNGLIKRRVIDGLIYYDLIFENRANTPLFRAMRDDGIDTDCLVIKVINHRLNSEEIKKFITHTMSSKNPLTFLVLRENEVLEKYYYDLLLYCATHKFLILPLFFCDIVDMIDNQEDYPYDFDETLLNKLIQKITKMSNQKLQIKTKPITLSCTYEIARPENLNDGENKFTPVIDSMLEKQSRLLALGQQQARTLEKKSMFLYAYQKSMGVISVACAHAGIKSRKTVYNWINSDPEFKKALDQTIEIRNDFVDDMMMMQIAKGKFGAVTWYLSHRHPDYIRKRTSIPPRPKVDPWKKAYKPLIEDESV